MKHINDIVYNPAIGRAGLGDLLLPDIETNAPTALLIHGGGWNSMSKDGMAGVADFLGEIGIASFNVNYRLLDKAPFPANVEDCVSAARFLMTSSHKKFIKLKRDRLLFIGASAGAHLALLTGLKLGVDAVAGIVSISGIVDLNADMARHPDRYNDFWRHQPSADDIVAASPLEQLKADSPPILCTHAAADEVVYPEGAKKFAARAKALGARVHLFDYERPQDGHCIWIPCSTPHRLYPEIEREISAFCAEILSGFSHSHQARQ